MKNFVMVYISICIMLISIVVFSVKSCSGNAEITDGLTKESNTFSYAIVQLPNGEVYEGEVDTWADYKSDAVKIRFKDGQVIVTSYNKAVLMKNIPNK